MATSAGGCDTLRVAKACCAVCRPEGKTFFYGTEFAAS
jgi:hypothetical protein